jgi:GNAT superfamily N-acetyltransferase
MRSTLDVGIARPVPDRRGRQSSRTAGDDVVIEIVQLTAPHVDACAAIFEEALGDLMARMGMPPRSRAPEVLAETASRVRHLVATDPDGSWVAIADGTPVAFTQAIRRDRCWVLVHLFVRPGSQSSGAGTRLLALARTYAADAPVGLIGASADHRAMRAYAQLPGFRTCPTLSATGLVRAAALRGSGDLSIRDGRAGDLDEIEALDQRLRGGTRAPDIAYLVERGHRLRVMPGRGYCLVGPEMVDMLSAVDDESAAALLVDALVLSDGRPTIVGRMTVEQQWALPIVIAAGLDLRPWGPFVVRGLPAAPAPYLPSLSMC